VADEKAEGGDVKKVVITKGDGSEIVLNADKDTHFALSALIKDTSGNEDGYWSLSIINGREKQIYESVFQTIEKHPDMFLYFLMRIAEEVSQTVKKQRQAGWRGIDLDKIDLSKIKPEGNA